jgi:hypothetical protein
MENEMVYAISIDEIQNESLIRLGRRLNSMEIDILKDGLEWGIGESLNIIYGSIFKTVEENE